MSILAESSVTVIPAGTWSIDPSWSALEFEVRKLRLGTPSVVGAVDATSITTFEADRDAHLQSPDFFDTQRYPELRFVSTSVETSDDEIVVHGDLTIKDVTRPVELRGTLSGPENDPWGNERIGLELSTTIDRTAFGLEWNAPLPGGGFLLPNDVALKAYFAATRTA